MSNFNLRNLVNDVLDESPMNDPHDLAPLVLARIAEANREHALLALLPGYVTSAMGARLRQQTAEPEAEAAPAPRVGVSRMAGLRSALLAERVRGAESWKSFGDCVAADLLALIDYREGLSRGNLAWAQKYRRVLDAMLESGAERVADLGENAVRDLMAPQAVSA